MEGLALGSGFDHSNPNTEIAKSLAFLPLKCIALQEWHHDLHNLLFLDGTPVKLVEPLSMVTTAKIHCIKVSNY